MGFNDGFEIFDLMFIIIPIFIVIVAGIILFTFIKGIKTWSHNNKQPRLTVGAVVVSKRMRVSGGGDDHSSSTWYYATFQVESGDRMEFSVGGRNMACLRKAMSASYISKVQDTMDLHETKQGYRKL